MHRKFRWALSLLPLGAQASLDRSCRNIRRVTEDIVAITLGRRRRGQGRKVLARGGEPALRGGKAEHDPQGHARRCVNNRRRRHGGGLAAAAARKRVQREGAAGRPYCLISPSTSSRATRRVSRAQGARHCRAVGDARCRAPE